MGIETAAILTAAKVVTAVSSAVGAGVSVAGALRKPKTTGPSMLLPNPTASPLSESTGDKGGESKRGYRPTISTSPLGDQTTASTGRSKLLGN